jgi:hypothetical protein
MKPTTRTARKMPIAIRPNPPTVSRDTAQGNRKAISRSKMMKRIATRY